MKEEQSSLFPEDKKPGRFDGLDRSIEVLVNKAVIKRFPEGEPEPRLFSEGYRAALKEYSEFRAAMAVKKVLGGVFPETR